jgi:hypothetical protein
MYSTHARKLEEEDHLGQDIFIPEKKPFMML